MCYSKPTVPDLLKWEWLQKVELDRCARHTAQGRTSYGFPDTLSCKWILCFSGRIVWRGRLSLLTLSVLLFCLKFPALSSKCSMGHPHLPSAHLAVLLATHWKLVDSLWATNAVLTSQECLAMGSLHALEGVLQLLDLPQCCPHGRAGWPWGSANKPQTPWYH